MGSNQITQEDLYNAGVSQTAINILIDHELILHGVAIELLSHMTYERYLNLGIPAGSALILEQLFGENSLQVQLSRQREILSNCLQVMAVSGRAYTPPDVLTQIRDAREKIAQIKQQMREKGIPVEDLPDDTSVPH